MTVRHSTAGVTYHFEWGTFHHRSADKRSADLKPDPKLWAKNEREKTMAMLFDPGDRHVVRKKSHRGESGSPPMR